MENAWCDLYLSLLAGRLAKRRWQEAQKIVPGFGGTGLGVMHAMQ